jgi:carbonic anhydrase/acetyltransferase-like protein (isoleucine patch superfamily)
VRVRLARLRHSDLDRDLAPLALGPGEILLGGVKQAAWQQQEAQAAGLELVDVEAGAPLPAGTRVLCTSQSVFSRETLVALLARTQAELVQATIRAGTPLAAACTRVRPCTTDVRLPLWAGALEGRRVDVEAMGAVVLEARAEIVCDEDTAASIAVRPHGRPPHRLLIPDVTRLGGTLAHWMDALEMSLAVLRLARRRQGLAGPDERNAIGDADIHPTATVLGSIIEDGARIEAHASVIDSFVGKDAHIADHTVVEGSVLGAGTRTLVDTSIRRVVAHGDGTLSNLSLSDVVVGPGVFVTTAVSFFGPDPGTDAIVEGIDTRRPVLGGAIGARAVLGARALLAAGIAIPAGALIVARPNEAASKLDDAGLARAAMRHGDRATDV